MRIRGEEDGKQLDTKGIGTIPLFQHCLPPLSPFSISYSRLKPNYTGSPGKQRFGLDIKEDFRFVLKINFSMDFGE